MAFNMQHVTEHMGMYTTAESIQGQGWLTFSQGLVNAIQRDMATLRQEVIDEASIANAPTTPPAAGEVCRDLRA